MGEAPLLRAAVDPAVAWYRAWSLPSLPRDRREQFPEDVGLGWPLCARSAGNEEPTGEGRRCPLILGVQRGFARMGLSFLPGLENSLPQRGAPRKLA